MSSRAHGALVGVALIASLTFILLMGSGAAPTTVSVTFPLEPVDDYLDPGFGVDGRVRTDLSGTTDTLRALIIQPDGKLVASGWAGGPQASAGLALARYNRDGSLDESFGDGGKVVTVVEDTLGLGEDLVLQPDGKIVVAGAVSTSGPHFGNDFLVARYHPDGSLDTEFGSDGLVIMDFGGIFSETGRAMVLQPDGKLVVGGQLNEGLALVRLNGDGSPDSTFGSGGKAVAEFDGPLDAHAIVLQPDGKLVIGGWVNTGPPPGTGADFTLARFTPDGDPDTTFGIDGRTMTDFPSLTFVSSDVLRDLLLQPDGRLVAVGSAFPQAYSPEGPDFALARYNPDGSLDPAFGDGGKVVTHLGGDDRAHAGVLQPDGKIVAVGFTGRFGFPTREKDFALVRYNPDGSLDDSIGGGSGSVTIDFAGLEDEANAVVRQPNAKLVLAGPVGGFLSPPYPDFALARLNLEPEDENEPPLIECGQTGPYRTDVGQCSADLSCQLIASCTDPEMGDVVQTCTPNAPYLPGQTNVVVECTDGQETAIETCVVAVKDDEAPTITVDVTPDTLWPPNHRMVDVDASVVASDNCTTPSVVLSSVTSNEPDNGVGDGNTINDIQDAEPGTTDFSFRLRAERAGGGNGRIYTVICTATDAAGNTASAAGFTVAPHDRGGMTDPLEVFLENNRSGTLVWWAPAPGAQSYDVIRGQLSNIEEIDEVIRLDPVTCIELDSTDETTAGWEDSALPGPGQAFVYLVEYDDGTGSSYGTESADKPRAPGPGDCR